MEKIYKRENYLNKILLVQTETLLERVARIELAQPGRKHGILPLNYTRIYNNIIQHKNKIFN